MKTPHQKTVLKLIEQEDDWITVAKLSALSGIAEGNMRNILRQKSFLFLDRGILDTGLPHGGRYVRVYRIPCNVRNTDDALALAKQHQGLFGQLFWASDAKIEMMA
jgi:hypothetical protein